MQFLCLLPLLPLFDWNDGLLRTTTRSCDIVVNWKQYNPTMSHPPLIDLKDPFTKEEIRGAVFSLVQTNLPDLMVLI